MDPAINDRNTEPLAPWRISLRRFSAVGFLIFLITFFLSAPLLERLPHGDFIDGSLLTLVLITGALAVGSGQRRLIVAIVLAAPAVIGRWAHQYHPDLPQVFFLAPALVFVVFLITSLLHSILYARRVNIEVLSAGISVYLLLGTAWMFAYLLVSEMSPGAFGFTAGPDTNHVLSGFNAYYFSFTTLCTLGYGDIVPVSHTARMLAATEGVTGTLYVAVLIARLVALYSNQTSAANKPDDASEAQSRKTSGF